MVRAVGLRTFFELRNLVLSVGEGQHSVRATRRRKRAGTYVSSLRGLVRSSLLRCVVLACICELLATGKYELDLGVSHLVWCDCGGVDCDEVGKDAALIQDKLYAQDEGCRYRCLPCVLVNLGRYGAGDSSNSLNAHWPWRATGGSPLRWRLVPGSRKVGATVWNPRVGFWAGRFLENFQIASGNSSRLQPVFLRNNH